MSIRTPAASPRGRRRAALTGSALALAGVAAASPAAAVRSSAGNGIDRLTPAAALARAHQALGSQANVVLAGTLEQQGARIDLRLRSAAHGKRSAGMLVSHSSTAGFFGTLRFVALGAVDYLDGGKAFWTHSLAAERGLSAAQRARLASVLSGTWIELTGKDATAFTRGLSTLTDPRLLARELTTPEGRIHKGAPKLLRSMRALPIVSSKGGTLWLALVGPPLPIEVTAPRTSSTSGSVVFGYPRRLTIVAPKGAKTLRQLGA